MKTREDKELTRHMRQKWPSEHYGIAALTIAVGLYLLISLAGAAFASPPIASKLQAPLLAAARPKVAELRRKLASKGAGVAETHGMFVRAPECVVKNIIGARVQQGTGGDITGLVTVACTWKSPDQRTFASREEAEEAELTEEEPGKLRLTFVWTGGHWQYKSAKKG